MRSIIRTSLIASTLLLVVGLTYADDGAGNAPAVKKSKVVIEITRDKATPLGTFGTVTVNGQFVCYSLEPDAGGGPLGKGPIPAGSYASHPRGGQHGTVLGVENVSNFTEIELHGGNTRDDTAGCTLLGTKRDPDKGWLSNGQDGVKALNQAILGSDTPDLQSAKDITVVYKDSSTAIGVGTVAPASPNGPQMSVDPSVGVGRATDGFGLLGIGPSPSTPSLNNPNHSAIQDTAPGAGNLGNAPERTNPAPPSQTSKTPSVSPAAMVGATGALAASYNPPIVRNGDQPGVAAQSDEPSLGISKSSLAKPAQPANVAANPRKDSAHTTSSKADRKPAALHPANHTPTPAPTPSAPVDVAKCKADYDDYMKKIGEYRLRETLRIVGRFDGADSSHISEELKKEIAATTAELYKGMEAEIARATADAKDSYKSCCGGGQ